MSQWTHVNASIRYDSVMGMGVPTEKDLGVICTFDNWKETDIPCGSEGSIKYSIFKNTNVNQVASTVVVFYGDLRDYDNDEEIFKYFTKITDGKMIRSGILEIDIESKGKYIYIYDNETSEWVQY